MILLFKRDASSRSRIVAAVTTLAVMVATILPSEAVSASPSPDRVAYEERVARVAAQEATRLATAAENAIRRALGEWAGASYGAASLAGWARRIARGSNLHPPRSHPPTMVRLVISKVDEALRLGRQAKSEAGTGRLSLVNKELEKAKAAHQRHPSPVTSQALARATQAQQRVREVLALLDAIKAWAPAAVLVAKVGCHDLTVMNPPSWWEVAKDPFKLPKKVLNPGPFGDLGPVTRGVWAWGYGMPDVTDHLRPVDVIPQIMSNQPYVTNPRVLSSDPPPPEVPHAWRLDPIVIDLLGVVPECTDSGR